MFKEEIKRTELARELGRLKKAKSLKSVGSTLLTIHNFLCYNIIYYHSIYMHAASNVNYFSRHGVYTF